MKNRKEEVKDKGMYIPKKERTVEIERDKWRRRRN